MCRSQWSIGVLGLRLYLGCKSCEKKLGEKKWEEKVGNLEEFLKLAWRTPVLSKYLGARIGNLL